MKHRLNGEIRFENDSVFPSSYSEYVYNFAYGSNMYPNVLSGRRKIHPIESIAGVLEGWQLTFDLRGVPGIEPCFGNIKENPTAEVHGVLHKMTGKEFKHLLATEGGGGVDENGYIPIKLNVRAYDNRSIEAYALVVRQASPIILREFAQPSSRYMTLLCNGATHHKLHPLYIKYLQSLLSHERSIPVTIVVIIQVLILFFLSAPVWIPHVLYSICTNQKARARSHTLTAMMNSLWRIYRLLNIFNPQKPYSYTPSQLGSTKLNDTTPFM